MDDLYRFAGNNPWLAFFLALIAGNIVIYPLKLVNRWIRHRNIVAAGWPPFHLDGDGDTRTLDSDDIEALKANRAALQSKEAM
jgi:hypothetical protein